MNHDDHHDALRRRDFVRILAAVGGASALSLASTRVVEAAMAPSTINASFFVETKPTMIAKAEGWFSKMAGAKINWSEAGSGGDVNTAMAAGSLDFGLALGSSPAAAGISQKLGYQVVGMVDNIGPAEDLIVRASEHITKPSDLKGKKIATPFGSTSHFRLLGYLTLHNLSQGQVTVLDMRPNAMVAAWHRGDIDGGYVWNPAKSKLLEDGGVLFSTYKECDAHGYVIADLIAARTSFSEKYPEAVSGFLKAYGRALALYRDKPNEAIRIVAKQAGVSFDVAKKGLSEYDFVPLEDQLSQEWLGAPGKPGKFAKVLKRTADFLVAQKSIRSAPGLEAFEKGINTRFLAQALKA